MTKSSEYPAFFPSQRLKIADRHDRDAPRFWRFLLALGPAATCLCFPNPGEPRPRKGKTAAKVEADLPQRDNREYRSKIREYTTEKFFLTDLVDLFFANNPFWKMETSGSYVLVFNAALNYDNLSPKEAVEPAGSRLP